MFNRLSRLGNHNPTSDAASKWTQPARRLPEPITLCVASWRPSSSLHLDELHALLTSEKTGHDEKRRDLLRSVQLRSVSREISYLEYIRVATASGIEIKAYQDGLMVVSVETVELESAQSLLDEFLTTKWEPLVSIAWPDELRHYGDKRLKKPLIVASPSVLEQNGMLPAEFGETLSQQQDSQRMAITTDKYTVLVSLKGKTEATDLAELYLLFDQMQNQLQQLLKQIRSMRQSVHRLERADTIQPHRLSFWHTKLVSLRRGSDYAVFWLDQMKNIVSVRQEISHKLALEPALENLFFHSPAQLLENIGSVSAQYQLLGSSLNHQAAQLQWWQRKESSQQAGLARTFLLTLTVLFIGYIAFGSDKLRWDNGGGLVLVLLVVGSLMLSLCISFLINHQEFRNEDNG